jgi:hypothetical protein
MRLKYLSIILRFHGVRCKSVASKLERLVNLLALLVSILCSADDRVINEC